MRKTQRLTIAAIKKLLASPPEKARYYNDGAGLHLQVAPGAAGAVASWIYRYRLNGRERAMGLGRFPDVGLADARMAADGVRKLKAGGIDPLGQRSHARRTAQREDERRITVADAAEAFIAVRATGWSAGTVKSWRDSLKLHINPRIGRWDVSDIDTPQVMKVIEPLWLTKNATAALVRARLEAILDWSITNGRRAGPNPARFENHLERVLPQAAKKGNRPALPWQAMPAFMTKLRALDGIAARAVEFLTLTGARLEEATEARWREIDIEGRVWTVPAGRMKMGAIHEVPLGDQVLALLDALPGEHRPDDLIFPSERTASPIAGSVANGVLRKLGYAKGEVCIHGSRSSLRTWLADCTDAPKDVCEAMIAHDERKRDVVAYERTRFFKQRIPLMVAWADYLHLPPDANVVPLNHTRAKAAA